MAADLAEFRNETGDDAARKAELFRYLDEIVGARRILSAMEVPKAVTALSYVQPVRIPKHIWMYWDDGWDTAPEIAKLCLKSWRMRNPGHVVHALDRASLPQFLAQPPVHRNASKLNGFANRVRLKLLRIHGGVWADATLFCLQPLDAWLSMLMAPARCFAFARPAPDRLVATWFLAAIPGAPLMRAWERLYTAYFAQLEAEQRWVHAYFAMAYVLEYALAHHAGLDALWAMMPKVPAPESGRITTVARLLNAEAPPEALDAAQCDSIREVLAATQMQKLTWKGGMRESSEPARQVLALLQENLAAGGVRAVADR